VGTDGLGAFIGCESLATKNGVVSHFIGMRLRWLELALTHHDGHSAIYTHSMMTQHGGRLDWLDALRGAAVVWMAVFHLCFDLSQFGWFQHNFYDEPLWVWQRTVIVSLFLFCAGFGQAIAAAQGQTWRRFWRRWVQVLGGALLVTLGSWLMFPNSFIYFGTLHGMALMLIIARLTTRWGGWLWFLGAVAIAAKFAASYALQTGDAPDLANALNAPAWNWIGWITHKPTTEDYVPLFPWMGVMWWGVASGHWLLRHATHSLTKPLPVHQGSLAWLGRHSLFFYLLHQPVLIGTMVAIVWLSKVIP